MATTVTELRACRCCGARFTSAHWPDLRGEVYCERCRVLSWQERQRVQAGGELAYRDQRWEERIRWLVQRPLPGHSGLVLDDFFL